MIFVRYRKGPKMKMLPVEIIKHKWFTTAAGSVGIVQIKNSVGDLKSYISAVDGCNQETDLQYVAKWGAKFPNSFWDGV